ncbi:Glycosaminoglycan xylosylkinase homolog [Eumeta japonica]|uniref:Glycosaminoglycan xylosylkinase homolog n=1 Tax=Eumeta variegata TaxID=151549 RepID=A0A4C1VGA0_EUMVA|nr:Glycosaminoglycan xylosylkinase homolog [Eumeta japonica]
MLGRKSKLSRRNKRTIYKMYIRTVMKYASPVFAHAAPKALHSNTTGRREGNQPVTVSCDILCRDDSLQASSITHVTRRRHSHVPSGRTRRNFLVGFSPTLPTGTGARVCRIDIFYLLLAARGKQKKKNGDRHHYEVYKGKILLFDNGKGLSNPWVDELDILAPLYQCCLARSSVTSTRASVAGAGMRIDRRCAVLRMVAVPRCTGPIRPDLSRAPLVSR